MALRRANASVTIQWMNNNKVGLARQMESGIDGTVPSDMAFGLFKIAARYFGVWNSTADPQALYAVDHYLLRLFDFASINQSISDTREWELAGRLLAVATLLERPECRYAARLTWELVSQLREELRHNGKLDTPFITEFYDHIGELVRDSGVLEFDPSTD